MCRSSTKNSDPSRRRRRGGFTLVELLVVMFFMILLLTMSVGDFFGMGRSTRLAGTVANVRGVLSLARQWAVSHRGKTTVVFEQTASNAYYYVVWTAGVCGEDSGPSGGYELCYDRARGFDNPKAAVYNTTAWTSGTVATNTAVVIGCLPAAVTWSVGDGYGWQVRDRAHLPAGARFDTSVGTWGVENGVDVMRVDFAGDGGLSGADPANQSLKVVEDGVETPASTTFTVYGLTGVTSVQ